MDEDFVVQAMRSVFSVRQAFNEQAQPDRTQHQEVETPTGKIYVGGSYGSAFCFHEDGLLVTCEHVRQDTHKWSNRSRRDDGRIVNTPHSKSPAFVVVCPYEGGDAELNWQHSWRAEFVAHTGIEDPNYQNLVPEVPPLPPGMILPDKIDLAILRLVEPVAATPLAKPPPLRFSRIAPVAKQECWVLGYPPAGGTTPTLVPMTCSFTHGNALKVIGAMLKVDGRGAMTMPGHSGGPLVTTSGTVVGWNYRRNDELSHAQPIAAAEKCIGLVLTALGLAPIPLPCSSLLDPRWAGKEKSWATEEPLFGREEDELELLTALRRESAHRYFLVLGAAGLGKTALVKSVARTLVASGSTGSRFRAVVFVELRARETENAVRTAVCDAIKNAGVSSSNPVTLPPDALLILDNADDPYKMESNQSDRSLGGGWFEERVLPEYKAWGCTILMTMRYVCPAHTDPLCFGPFLCMMSVTPSLLHAHCACGRDEGHAGGADQSLFNQAAMLPHLASKRTIGPLKKEAGLVLLRHLMQEFQDPNPRALSGEQEQSILGVSGGNAGVSPLMLSFICGVLCNKVLTGVNWEKDDTTVSQPLAHPPQPHTQAHGRSRV